MSSIYKKVAKDLFAKYIPLVNGNGEKKRRKQNNADTTTSKNTNNNTSTTNSDRTSSIRISCSFIEIAGDFCFDLFNSSASTQLLTGCDGTVYAFPVVEPEVRSIYISSNFNTLKNIFLPLHPLFQYFKVKSEEELVNLIDFACGVRSTASTGVHDTSSR